jgi:site-specific DNA recombinase
VEPAMPSIHPKLAEHYCLLVERLQEELAEPELAASAKTMLRSMIKEIRITPGEKRGQCNLELVGDLAKILALCQGARNRGASLAFGFQASVVAGACNHLDLQLGNLLSATLQGALFA